MKTGQTMYLNDPGSKWYNQPVAIVAKGRKLRNGQHWEINIPGERFTYFYPETALSPVPIAEQSKGSKQQPNESPFDFDGGFGIGGLGRYEETPIVPLLQAIERLERLERSATRCRRCGASSLDGTMFTTIAGGNVCDDCVG